MTTWPASRSCGSWQSCVFRNEVKGYVPVVFRSWYENLWIDQEVTGSG